MYVNALFPFLWDTTASLHQVSIFVRVEEFKLFAYFRH